MLDLSSDEIKKNLLSGEFGLEMEGLRTDEEGYLAHTPHPFPENDHIVRDFCENQTEINTEVEKNPHAVVRALGKYYREIQDTLAKMPKPELFWAFSNPPYIKDEGDIPVASFTGADRFKTTYRDYLSDRYGRYKMTFSGIHVNYSFSEELLNAAFLKSGQTDYVNYKNQVYLDLAANLSVYGWLLVAVTAASPLLDSSYVEKGRFGKDVFLGLASVRCSELGYWNFFSPVLNYEDIVSYVESIRHYIRQGLIQAPSELYYPIRLKPKGANSLDALAAGGVNHIELRMIDVNPLAEYGIDERDLAFAQLFICWLAAKRGETVTASQQVQAVQNFKNAAHYDLKTVKIVMPGRETDSAADMALSIIREMMDFYQDYPDRENKVKEVLKFQEEKFLDPEKRYAWQIRKKFGEGYVEKGIRLAKAKRERSTGGIPVIAGF